MIAGLADRFRAMTRREQVMVALAAVLAGLVVLIYGVIFPVGHAFDAAVERHVEGARRSGRLLAQLEALKAPAPAAGAAVAVAGPVDQALATAAQEAGLTLQSNQPQGNDSAQIAIPAARPQAALAWIDGLGAQGFAVDSLTMTPMPDGGVAISATVRRAAR